MVPFRAGFHGLGQGVRICELSLGILMLATLVLRLLSNPLNLLSCSAFRGFRACSPHESVFCLIPVSAIESLDVGFAAVLHASSSRGLGLDSLYILNPQKEAQGFPRNTKPPPHSDIRYSPLWYIIIYREYLILGGVGGFHSR